MQQGRWTAWSSIPTFSNWQLPARTPTSACMATENIELLASQTTVRCEDTCVTFRWPGIDCENTSLEVLWKYLSWGIVQIPLLGYCDWEDTNRRYYAYTWDTAIEAEMLPCIITISLTLVCAILNMCRKCEVTHMKANSECCWKNEFLLSGIFSLDRLLSAEFWDAKDAQFQLQSP